jgi:predicted O-methyltransferase YrrM
MDMVTGIQPRLAPLYLPDERFEISAAGLDEWQRSVSFKRTTIFYLSYPARSLLSHASRAVLHHLIVMKRPRLALEIGTYQAGTSEVMARAMWEAGQGHLETIDPYGAERCPPMIAALPTELQQRISFSPVTSALHFDHAMARGALYDLVFIDGNHEFEFARFDLECAARLMRPGGIIVLDNVSQSGPRLATKLFLESNPQWRDIMDVVRWINPDDPMAPPIPSIGRTEFYLIEAPPHHAVGGVPRSFGSIACDRAEVDGIDLDLAAPARGTLHLQVYARTFDMQEPEELQAQQRFALDQAAGPVRLPLDPPLRTAVHADGLTRRVEIVLAFTGDGGLALRSSPMPYPAQPV